MPWITNGNKWGDAQSLGYKWGPFGHPLQIGSTSSVAGGGSQPADFQYDALYWDDDDLLFTLNPSGQIDDIKVANFGDYVPGATNPLTVWDRDINGQIYGCHTTGSPTAVLSSAFQNNPIKCGMSGSFQGPTFGAGTKAVGRGGMLTMPKSDGLNDGQNTFQGVRTYDPQAGTWTTPDAYHGNVHDPMSQKPYMWNKNNPYAYLDPSGYDVIMLIDPNSAGPANHQSMFVYDPKTQQGTFWQAGPANSANSSGNTLVDKMSIAPGKSMSLDDAIQSHGGQEYFHIGTSASQDGKINGAMGQMKAAADAGTLPYVAVGLNCADVTNTALQVAGVPVGFLLTTWPAANAGIMQGLGMKFTFTPTSTAPDSK